MFRNVYSANALSYTPEIIKNLNNDVTNVQSYSEKIRRAEGLYKHVSSKKIH